MWEVTGDKNDHYGGIIGLSDHVIKYCSFKTSSTRSAGCRIHSANYCPSLIQIGWKKKLWRPYDQKGDPKCHNLFYTNRLTFMYAEEIKHNIMKILRNHSNYPKKYLCVTIHSVIIIAIYLVVIRLLFVKLGFR